MFENHIIYTKFFSSKYTLYEHKNSSNNIVKRSSVSVEILYTKLPNSGSINTTPYYIKNRISSKFLPLKKTTKTQRLLKRLDHYVKNLRSHYRTTYRSL